MRCCTAQRLQYRFRHSEGTMGLGGPVLLSHFRLCVKADLLLSTFAPSSCHSGPPAQPPLGSENASRGRNFQPDNSKTKRIE